MSRPFTREDAKVRARLCRNEAQTWEGAVCEREQFAAEYTDPADRLAAAGCLEIMRLRLVFTLEMADAYERVAVGMPPFV